MQVPEWQSWCGQAMEKGFAAQSFPCITRDGVKGDKKVSSIKASLMANQPLGTHCAVLPSAISHSPPEEMPSQGEANQSLQPQVPTAPALSLPGFIREMSKAH